MAFVNRRDELDRLNRFANAVVRGAPERNIAVIGPRRVGKTFLLHQFATNNPPVLLIPIAADSASATLHQFLLAMVRSSISAAASRAGYPPISLAAGPLDIAASAAHLGPAASRITLAALAIAGERKPAGDRLLAAGAGFPEELSRALDLPVIVVVDEFQHVSNLASFKPYGGGVRRAGDDAVEQLLGELRPHMEKRPHCGWLVTGSSIRMITKMLNSRLMGRFDEIRLGFLEADDCAELAEQAFKEEAVQATDSATKRIFSLSLGHPFYADVTAREASIQAMRLQGPVSGPMVERAFLDSVQRPGGQIRLACDEMLTSLDNRTGQLRGVLDALAPRGEATLSELSDAAGLVPSITYRHADTLERLGIVDRMAESKLRFSDPVFRYYVAEVRDPLREPPDLGDPTAAAAAARHYEEAYLREREERGPLTEAYVRDLARNFNGQMVNGNNLGAPGRHVTLPVSTGDVRRVTAPDPEGDVFGYAAEVELDLCIDAEVPWLGEVKDRRAQATVADIELAAKKAAFIRHAHQLKDGPVWFISFGGYAQTALARAKELGMYASNKRDLEALKASAGTRKP